jgi:hypothetical protein
LPSFEGTSLGPVACPVLSAPEKTHLMSQRCQRMWGILITAIPSSTARGSAGFFRHS